MKNSLFTVYIEQDEYGVFIGSIPTVPSCYRKKNIKRNQKISQ
ncbi:MAG: hypothetical protein V1910_03020 [bacterium]